MSTNDEVVDATVETTATTGAAALANRSPQRLEHGDQYALARLTDEEFADTLARNKLQQRRMKQVVRNLMDPGTHYGVPGETDVAKIKAAAEKGKVGLYKAGAEMLLKLFKYVGKVEVRVEQGDPHNHNSPAVTVYATCTVYADNFDGPIMGVGVGACTSWEEKYRWRNAAKACPECGVPALRFQKEGKFGVYKGKPTFWCAPNRDGSAGGGCGLNFAGNDARIAAQESGKVATPNAHDQLNTYVKMAAKRARVDGAIAATGSSDLLTQDIEDLPGSTVSDPYDHEDAPPAKAAAPRRAAGGAKAAPMERKEAPAVPAHESAASVVDDAPQSENPAPGGTVDPFTEVHRRRLWAVMNKCAAKYPKALGFLTGKDEKSREDRLRLMGQYLGEDVTSTTTLTGPQMSSVADQLLAEYKPDATDEGATS